MKLMHLLEQRRRQCLPFIIAAAASGVAMAADLPADEVVKKLGPAIVIIVVSEFEGAEASSAQSTSTKAVASPDTKGRILTSGVIVSPDGLILTECSAFAKSKPTGIAVYLDGARQLKAALIGVDSRSCLALIKIPVTDSAYVPLKPIQGLAAGERVLALGRTLLGEDAQVTVTDGIVSAVFSDQSAMPAIQSSVALMHGMGGGPLVRQRTGEVIGISTQRYVSREQGMQATFATPIESYLRVADELRTKGRVERATIGIRMATLTADIAVSLGIPDKKGVIIQEALDGSAAKTAGIEPGDVVFEADGLAITSVFNLIGLLRDKHPGEVVHLTIYRRGKTIPIDVTTTSLK